MAEQLSILDRLEVGADGMATALLLPDDMSELWAWIDGLLADMEGPAGPPRPIATPFRRDNWSPGEPKTPNYACRVHPWVVRDLIGALRFPDANEVALLNARERGEQVDAREVRSLIARVAGRFRYVEVSHA